MQLKTKNKQTNPQQSNIIIYKHQPNYFFFSMTKYRVGAVYTS